MRWVLVVGILNTGADLVYPFIPMALAFPPLELNNNQDPERRLDPRTGIVSLTRGTSIKYLGQTMSAKC